MREEFAALDELLNKRDVKKAEIAIAKLIRSDLPTSEYVETLIYRARTRLMSGRAADAIADLLSLQDIALERFNSPAVLELLADCYFARFEFAAVGFADRADAAQAQQIYERVLRDFPDYENLGWIDYQLGRALLATNQVESAKEYFHNALLAPSSNAALTAFSYERLGFVAFYEERDSSRALTFLRKAVDTYPASEDRLWLAQVQILRSRVLRERDYSAALEAAEAALTTASNARTDNKLVMAEALFAVAELLLKREGRAKEVVAHLQQFLQISRRPLGVDVTWSRVHEMLGDAYMSLDQLDAAIDAYQAALQFNPYHPWESSIHYRIACCYYQLNDYKKAIGAIEQILSKIETEDADSSDYRIYDVLGNALFALGQYNQAAEAYETAIRLAPASADLDKIRTYHRFAQELNQPL